MAAQDIFNNRKKALSVVRGTVLLCRKAWNLACKVW